MVSKTGYVFLRLLCEYFSRLLDGSGALKMRLTTLASIVLAIPILAGHAQFFDKASSVGFALSTAQSETSTDLLFQISAPEHAGWAAVGTGDRMDGSLMFIIYPSGQSNGALWNLQC